MMDDAELLSRYALNGDEAAFSELVQRCLPLVYSAALRQVRRPEIAEEVAQVVFVILARKAKRLNRDVILSGWLYQTTRYASHRAIRTEIRRIKREREAAQQGAQMEQSETKWNTVEPMLDDLMARLREQDRLVLVLRFFEGQSLAQIGDRLGTSEDAAQKRVARALDRLRTLFSKKSVPTSTAVLASLLGNHSVGAVPVGLAAGVVVTATSSAAAIAPLTATLLKSTLIMMTWIKIKTLAPVGAAFAVAASVPIVGLHSQKVALEEENRALQAATIAVADYASKSEELDVLKLKVAEFEALREQAAEVHLLRARVSQMSQERKAMIGQIDALKKALPTRVMNTEVSTGVDQIDPAAEQRIAVMSSLKQLALALHLYAGDHEGKFPGAISDLDDYLVLEASDAIALDDLVMIDYGTLKSIEEPQVSVILASREPIGQNDSGVPVWAYAFGDGHAELSPFELGEDGRLIK
jgi:RNA polymerase sigma factor (sigma-70 family)